ncbi:hypothetical protein ACFE04_018571 [Oxalis oulophora]
MPLMKQFPHSNCLEACGDHCGKGAGSNDKGAQGGTGAQIGKATTEECTGSKGKGAQGSIDAKNGRATTEDCKADSNGKGAQGGTGAKIGKATTGECKIGVGAYKKQFPQSNCFEACGDYCGKGTSSNGKGAQGCTKSQHLGSKV